MTKDTKTLAFGAGIGALVIALIAAFKGSAKATTPPSAPTQQPATPPPASPATPTPATPPAPTTNLPANDPPLADTSTFGVPATISARAVVYTWSTAWGVPKWIDLDPTTILTMVGGTPQIDLSKLPALATAYNPQYSPPQSPAQFVQLFYYTPGFGWKFLQSFNNYKSAAYKKP